MPFFVGVNEKPTRECPWIVPGVSRECPGRVPGLSRACPGSVPGVSRGVSPRTLCCAVRSCNIHRNLYPECKCLSVAHASLYHVKSRCGRCNVLNIIRYRTLHHCGICTLTVATAIMRTPHKNNDTVGAQVPLLALFSWGPGDTGLQVQIVQVILQPRASPL